VRIQPQTTEKSCYDVGCEGWVQDLWKSGKMEDGVRIMNVVAGYGGMGPMGAVGDDWDLFGGDWSVFDGG
jgi:hypothetical protein